MSEINADKIAQIINNAQKVEQHNYYSNKSALPNSVPSVSNFVGREDYLNELRESYKNGARCFVLHGTGGVGKTALALRFATEIKDEYKARVFVDMQGMSENRLSARDAMFNVVRQFDPDISADVSPEQLSQLFVQKVQAQPTLIVLDNARNKQSVEALKRANACFIVTSREAFTLTDAEGSKKISQMSPEDARNLLFKIAGETRFDGREDELATLAGYLPMALKPLASILAEDELETAADLINRYRDKKTLLDERVPDYDDLTIEASFELSYEALPDEMKERWRRLSVFPADFDETAIAGVLGISSDEVRKTQKHLRRFSLLEVNPETKRFNLHDLARIFTGEKLSEDERFQAQLQFAKHYASVLITAQKMQRERQENYYLNALKLIDAEWDNITVGQKWSAELFEKDDAIANLCMDYSGYARNFTILRLHPREDINWMESGLKAARKLANRQAEANRLCSLGITYKNLGEYRKAIEHYEQAILIHRSINDRRNEGADLGNLGIVYKNLGEYRKAIEYHKQALTISREINDRLGEGNSLGNLGLAYQNLGEYQKAIEYHKQALAIKREIGNRFGEGNSLSNLGLAYQKLSEYQKAIEYHKQALAIKREIGDRFGEGNILGNLGNGYYHLSKYRKAIEYHKQALAISCEVGDRDGEGRHLANLGIAYHKLGEYQKAIEYHEDALIFSREIGNRFGEGTRLGNLGNVYYSLGEREKACGLWKEAVTILEAIESPNANTFRQAIEENCRD